MPDNDLTSFLQNNIENVILQNGVIEGHMLAFARPIFVSAGTKPIVTGNSREVARLKRKGIPMGQTNSMAAAFSAEVKSIVRDYFAPVRVAAVAFVRVCRAVRRARRNIGQ